MRAAPIVCPEESPLPASVYDNYAVRRFAAGGLVRRLWLGSGIWCPTGFSPASVPEGFQRASGKPFDAPAGAYLCWGLTRRLRRGSRAYSPMGRSHFSFGGERKVCKRKPAARRLQRRPAPLRVAGFGLREPNGWMPRIYSGHPIPALRPEQSDHVPWADCPQGLSSTSVRCAHPPGKRLLLPILMAGLAMSRAMKLDSFHKLLERARARLFPPSKWAGLFPFAAYRRSVPPQLALGRLQWRCLRCFSAAGIVSQRRKTGLLFSSAVGAILTQPASLGLI